MYWAGDDVLPTGYGCACGGACASCAGASRGDYGMDPVTIAAIIAGSATLIATGVGAGSAAIQSKKQRDFAAKEAERQRKHEREVLREQAEAARLDQEALAAMPTSAPATTPAPTAGISTTTLLLGAGVLALVYFAAKD